MNVSDLRVGQSHSEIVVQNLTRTQLVMYAGASGDFNPLHTDEVYATQVAGYDRVVAHGQLTMGLTAKIVTRWVDEAEITAFGLRFKRQVWPGDTLTTTATVTTLETVAEEVLAELTLVTTNQHGVEVASGYARLREIVRGAG